MGGHGSQHGKEKDSWTSFAKQLSELLYHTTASHGLMLR
jgi:hypothetical protein